MDVPQPWVKLVAQLGQTDIGLWKRGIKTDNLFEKANKLNLTLSSFQ